MYYLVDEVESKRYRSDCSHILTNVCKFLQTKGITAQFTLVGSGARNMITRNGNGPFDLDYNMEIIKATNEYWNDLRKLKNTIRIALDNAEGFECFSEAQDSTSCLTALLHFTDTPSVEFSFDVAITAKNRNGNLCRLIHNKNIWGIGQDQYTWNEIPSSHDIVSKCRQIKKSNLWLDVRDAYVDLKNKYLYDNNIDHPSFIVYIEAVNQIYSKYFL